MCLAEEHPGDSPFCWEELEEMLGSARDKGVAANDMRRGWGNGWFCLEQRSFRESKSFFHFPKKAVGKIKSDFLKKCCQVKEAPGPNCKKGISGWTFSHEESLCKLFLLFFEWSSEGHLPLWRVPDIRYHLSSLAEKEWIRAEGAFFLFADRGTWERKSQSHGSFRNPENRSFASLTNCLAMFDILDTHGARDTPREILYSLVPVLAYVSSCSFSLPHCVLSFTDWQLLPS